MLKIKLYNTEILGMLRNCYESDVEHILSVHITGDKGLDYCIDRTLADLVLNDVIVYAIYNNTEFMGYFGDESGYLTGFFLMPNKRKDFKKDFWNEIVKHFNGSFKAGIYNKNEPAKKFLTKNGCNLIKTIEDKLIFELNTMENI